MTKKYSYNLIQTLLKTDEEQLARDPHWYMSHGCVYDSKDGKMVALTDFPEAEAKKYNASDDIANGFANARLIVYAIKALRRNGEIIQQLLYEVSTLREKSHEVLREIHMGKEDESDSSVA